MKNLPNCKIYSHLPISIWWVSNNSVYLKDQIVAVQHKDWKVPMCFYIKEVNVSSFENFEKTLLENLKNQKHRLFELDWWEKLLKKDKEYIYNHIREVKADIYSYFYDNTQTYIKESERYNQKIMHVVK